MYRTPRIDNQQGITIIVTLVFLLIASVLGIAAMSATKWEIQMARDSQQKTTSFVRSENAREQAEAKVHAIYKLPTLPNEPGVYDSTINPPPDVTNKAFWKNTANYVPTGETSGYVVEFLGIKTVVLDDRTTSTASNVYRLTTHGMGDDGVTETIAQSLYLED